MTQYNRKEIHQQSSSFTDLNMMEVNKILDEDVKRTERIKNMCEETVETGEGTITMLDDQGKQINDAKKKVENINADVKIAKHHVKGTVYRLDSKILVTCFCF